VSTDSTAFSPFPRIAAISATVFPSTYFCTRALAYSGGREERVAPTRSRVSFRSSTRSGSGSRAISARIASISGSASSRTSSSDRGVPARRADRILFLAIEHSHVWRLERPSKSSIFWSAARKVSWTRSSTRWRSLPRRQRTNR
jgi:hypothetical protein